MSHAILQDSKVTEGISRHSPSFHSLGAVLEGRVYMCTYHNSEKLLKERIQGLCTVPSPEFKGGSLP